MDKLLQQGFQIAKDKSANFEVENSLEEDAREIFELINSENNIPSQRTLRLCYDFLIAVEKWKMMAIECRLGNASQNDEQEIYNAFRGACLKKSDKEKLLSIMSLRGFGASTDKDFNRRAKAASAVMRFFYPESWGVVDWRLMAILNECKKNSWDWSKIRTSNSSTSKELRRDFDVINEDMCLWLMSEYRNIVRQSQLFARVADIDMALFHLSWLLWRK